MQFIPAFIQILGKAPRPLRWIMAHSLAVMLIYTPNRFKKITRRNIELAYSELRPIERRVLITASLRHLAIKIFDLMNTWFLSRESIGRCIANIEGFEEFNKARQVGPTLILLPHLGNWEIFGLWLSIKFPYTAMFRPLRVPALTELIRRAREKGGNHLVEADASGVRRLLMNLKQGGLGIVLPDQSPKSEKGEYIPFFGIQTLTPTLPYRLAKSTKATVFMATAIKHGSKYHISIEKLEADVHDRTTWLTKMNQLIESFVRKNPDQYQWEYRRFRNAPNGIIRYP